MKFIVDAQLPNEIAWIDQIIELLNSCNLVEMDNYELIGHE
ncbi:MAG: hypothetical protein Q8M08_02275 [Bacteroidales bacterium]|nr:hypothetical protein [Bacteroidales bacterium]